MARPSFLNEEWVVAYATNHLKPVSKADAFLGRARDLASSGVLRNCQCSPLGHLTATCRSSTPHLSYEVDVRVAKAADATAASCTCPSRQQEAVCKHVLALMLWAVGNTAAEPAAAPAGAGPIGRRRMPASLKTQQTEQQQQQQQLPQKHQQLAQQQPPHQVAGAAGSPPPLGAVHLQHVPVNNSGSEGGCNPVAAVGTRPAKRGRRDMDSSKPAPSRRKLGTGARAHVAAGGVGDAAALGRPTASLLPGPAMLAVLPEQLAAEARWVLPQVRQLVSAPAPSAAPSQCNRGSPPCMPRGPAPLASEQVAALGNALPAPVVGSGGSSPALPTSQRVSRLLSNLLGADEPTAAGQNRKGTPGSTACGASTGRSTAPSAAPVPAGGAAAPGSSTEPSVLAGRRRPMWERLLQQQEEQHGLE